MDGLAHLSRRERQIMDVIYARGRASATQVLEGMSDPPSRAAVRTFLRILQDKGHLRHFKRGKEFIYCPTQPRSKAARSALEGVLRTFFDGSIEQAVAARLADRGTEISDGELKRLASLVRQARAKGK
jgi:predicted transcriptional regulator